jgi:outer membrane protein assembly factor BamA
LPFLPPPTHKYTIKKIVFDGQNLYTQTELEAASSLEPGQTLNNEALQAASQWLVDTGLGEFLKWHIASRPFDGSSSSFKQTADPSR